MRFTSHALLLKSLDTLPLCEREKNGLKGGKLMCLGSKHSVVVRSTDFGVRCQSAFWLSSYKLRDDSLRCISVALLVPLPLTRGPGLNENTRTVTAQCLAHSRHCYFNFHCYCYCC